MASRTVHLCTTSASMLSRGGAGSRHATMARAKRGIYLGKRTTFGNNVAFTNQRTRRSFKPNVQTATFESAALERKFQLKVTTAAMRSIKKAGGLDEFLIKGRNIKDSLVAQELREKVLKVQETGIVPELSEYKAKGIRDKGSRPSRGPGAPNSKNKSKKPVTHYWVRNGAIVSDADI